MERAAARVCREAGARVALNVFVRDLNLDSVVRHDERRLEVIANGLSLWSGVQVAVDTTLVSPVRRDGTAVPGAARVAGTALSNAAKRKARVYGDVVAARRCRLVVLAVEIGGRWSEEAYDFVRQLAFHKAQTVPACLRRAAVEAWTRRWTGLLSVAASRAYAASLLDAPLGGQSCVGGAAPEFSELS